MPRERGRTLTTRLQFFLSCVRFETVSATVIKTPHPTYFQTTCDPCDAILCTIYRQLQFSLFFTAPLKLDRDSHDELTQSFSLYFSFFVFVVFVCLFFFLCEINEIIQFLSPRVLEISRLHYAVTLNYSIILPYS